MPVRLSTISANPTLRNFAQDASQSAITPINNFLAPRVEVPAMTGHYKKFDAKHRFKRPNTLRAVSGRATRIGFAATDATYQLLPRALDFPIPNLETMTEAVMLNEAQYGVTLLAESAALDDEARTIQLALEALGNGTDQNFTDPNYDPIPYLDDVITDTIKACRNGAEIRVLMGTTAWKRTKNNAKILARYRAGAKNGIATPNLEDLSQMLFANPKCMMSLMVEDQAAEGLDAAINFLLDEAIIVFAAKDSPTTMDPSFMKTLVLAGQYMTPGSYLSEDERDQVLKMDWNTQTIVANTTAGKRINAKAA